MSKFYANNNEKKKHWFFKLTTTKNTKMINKPQRTLFCFYLRMLSTKILRDSINVIPERINTININKQNWFSFFLRTLDELLAELNKLDILNFQQNVNEALFNFDTNSLLNTNATHHEYSCNIIIGVDFTASNEWKGRKTFNSQSLHKTLGNKTYNPYQKVISVLGFVVNKLIIANSVSSYSNPNNSNNSDTQQSLINTGLKIHAYGFGDQSTTDKSVFQLFEHQNQDSSALGSDFYYVDSFEEVLTR